MSLAKRLDAMVFEGLCPGEKANEILSARASFWEGHEKGGQGLLFSQEKIENSPNYPK